MAAPAGECSRLRTHTRLLQVELDEVKRERDDLMRDLENMCFSDNGATFNSSSVLQERIYSTGEQAKEHQPV
jgi:cell division protein FtsL